MRPPEVPHFHPLSPEQVQQARGAGSQVSCPHLSVLRHLSQPQHTRVFQVATWFEFGNRCTATAASLTRFHFSAHSDLHGFACRPDSYEAAKPCASTTSAEACSVFTCHPLSRSSRLRVPPAVSCDRCALIKSDLNICEPQRVFCLSGGPRHWLEPPLNNDSRCSVWRQRSLIFTHFRGVPQAFASSALTAQHLFPPQTRDLKRQMQGDEICNFF